LRTPHFSSNDDSGVDSSPDSCFLVVLGGENAFRIVKANIARWPQVEMSEARYLGSWTAAKHRKEIRSGFQGPTRRIRVHEPRSPGEKHTVTYDKSDRISHLLVIWYSRRFTSD
jgi:hypothetical protein